MTAVAPEHIVALLKKGHTATVELVTSKGTYVELCGHKVLLCSAEFGVVPNGISLDRPLQLQQNQKISCGDGRLMDLQVVAAQRDTALCTHDHGAALQALKNDPGTGFGLLVTDRDLPPECQIAVPLLKKLYGAILNEDPEAVGASAIGLLGLGKGLTPSGDDVLAGLIYGLRHSALRGATATAALCKAVQDYAHKRTNAVSADYLMAIIMDAPFERLKNALDCPEKLMEIGSNSGRELLLGRIMAARLIKCMEGA